jgi:hypothetical protein
MNPPNQPNRQYTNHSCELSIEDKKSPFPAWMKFNKPHPLKFSLSLADPERPEQRPTSITGDRAKLESLQQVVGDYVNELVVKAPLPSLGGNGGAGEMSGDLNRDPLRANQGNPTATEQEIGVDRPIDALKLTGDQPHLEADGSSSHLLYLGNLASDGQVMLSLSTLQLFDLSSTLQEGVLSSAPVTENSLASADLGLNSENLEHSVAPKPIEPEVIAAAAATGATAAVAAETVRQFDADVVEPRVVLPSVEEAISEDSLITESSLFERDSEARGGDRFKMPKPSLGSLNLPELPDFSNSPLTSIWLWLGLGTVATGIVASPLIGPTFNQLFSSSPKPSVVQTSTDPTAVSSLPPEFAPSQPPTPSGLPTTSPSSSFSTSPSPSMSASISPSVTAGGTTTYNPYGTGSGTAYNPYGTTTVPTTQPSISTGTGSSATGRGRMSPTPSTGTRSNSDPSLAARQPAQSSRNSGTFRSPSSVLRTTTPRASTGSTTGSDAMAEQARVYNPPTSSGQDFDRLPTTPETAAASSPSSASRRRGNTSPAPSSTDQPVQITGQDTPDLFSNSTGGRIDNPVTSVPSDSTPNLGLPSATNGLESAQAQETKQYFQRRWKADPNFQDSLQYNVRVDRNGKVMSINGQTENSRTYLNRTNFLKPGTKVAGANTTGQEQDVFVILKPDGSVDTFAQ